MVKMVINPLEVRGEWLRCQIKYQVHSYQFFLLSN